MNIITPQKIFKWINISPRINLTESWIFGYNERIKDSSGIFMQNEENEYIYNYL